MGSIFSLKSSFLNQLSTLKDNQGFAVVNEEVPPNLDSVNLLLLDKKIQGSGNIPTLISSNHFRDTFEVMKNLDLFQRI